VKLKKHALHLTVAAGMVGSMVAVAAPAAHAATALPDICGTYIQGTIDPTGGPLPGGILPLIPAGTSQTYAVFGHLAKGQDKEVITLGATGLGVTKASVGVTWGGIITGNIAENGPNAPYLTGHAAITGPPAIAATGNNGVEPTGGVTSMKLAWKTDKTTGRVLYPTVSVAEASATQKAAITKGVVTGGPGGDNLGVQIGNVQQGNAVVPQNTIDRVVVPQSGSPTDTYKLAIGFPNVLAAGPLAGVTLVSNSIQVNALAAQVATAINTSPTWAGIVGPSAAVAANTNPGDFNITFNGALQNQSLPLLGTLVPAGAPPAPPTVETQSAGLKAAVLDDGSIWNSTLFGGVDPGAAPVSDLGNGVVTATGIMSAGPVGGVAGAPTNGIMIGGKNNGKAGFVADSQFTYIQYPAQLIAGLAPNLNVSPGSQIAVATLAGLAGISPTSAGNACGLGGLLAIFCIEDAAVIPATFAGLCGAILS